MSDAAGNLERVRRYLRAIEEGNGAIIGELFTPETVFEQLPNRIYPQGLQASVTRMAEAFEKGRDLFSKQSYEITNVVAQDDMVSLEVVWTGTLAISFGKLEAGNQMRAYSAMFMKFAGGKIISQRNYDCFEPW